MTPNGIIGDEVIPLYVQDATLCLYVKSLQSGRVGFGQSPRLRSMQQDGLSKGRVESQFRIQTESPISSYSVQLAYYGISEIDAPVYFRGR